MQEVVHLYLPPPVKRQNSRRSCGTRNGAPLLEVFRVSKIVYLISTSGEIRSDKHVIDTTRYICIRMHLLCHHTCDILDNVGKSRIFNHLSHSQVLSGFRSLLQSDNEAQMAITILVTGGAGYVGSHTVVELLNSNYTVVAIDNLVNCYAEKYQKPESLKRVEKITGKQVVFYNTDVRDREGLSKIFKLVRNQHTQSIPL